MKNKNSEKLRRQINKLDAEIHSIENIQPPGEMDEDFYTMLEEQRRIIKPDFIVEERAAGFWSKFFGVWSATPLIQVAAGVIILIGGIFIGTNFGSEKKTKPDITKIQEEFFEMKEMLMYSLIENESPSQRIKAVNFTEEIESPDDKLLDLLIKTLNDDDNLNVRMASAYALGNFNEINKVKEAFIYALENETDTGMQIILINLLVQAGDKKAIKSLNKMLENNTIPPLVRDRAEKALQKL